MRLPTQIAADHRRHRISCSRLWGVLGTDNSLTLEEFENLVKEGKITYFIVADSGEMGDSSEIISYVKTNAEKVDESEYGGADKIGQISFSLYCFHK